MSQRRAGLGLLALALLVGGFAALHANGNDMATEFDAATWQDDARIYQQPFPRLAMAEALLGDKLVEGVPRADVLDLLGPPTDTPYFADWDLVYWLSESQRGLGVDSHWLVIDFDSSDELEKAKIVRD